MGRERGAVVIEDDPDIRALVVETLTMSGFLVEGVPSGRAGVEAVRESAPDLVTLDLGLPDLDGIEVCRRIRRFSHAYVIMITARSDEVDQLLGLEIGADDFIVKPFSPRALQSRITAMFRRSRQLSDGARETTVPGIAPADGADSGGPEVGSGSIRRGDLEVEPEARLVRRAGVELSLTRTEFDLLVTMLAAPRRVWTKESLLRAVWGGEWEGDRHLVEVHMGNLRRKLGDRGRDARWIQTVRGVGYRLVEANGA